MYVCIHVCIYIYIYMCVCVCVCLCAKPKLPVGSSNVAGENTAFQFYVQMCLG